LHFRYLYRVNSQARKLNTISKKKVAREKQLIYVGL